MSARPYRQGARAASVASTRAAILDAVDGIFLPDPRVDFTLEQVAQRSGTTIQTILRHFGTKGLLLEAAAERGLATSQAGRDAVPVGDLGAIAHYLAEHYEEVGPMVLRLLAAESRADALVAMNVQGREMHRAWVQRVLAPLLVTGPAKQRNRRLAMLIAVTDLLTWKVLRLEQGLSATEYERCVHELLDRMR